MPEPLRIQQIRQFVITANTGSFRVRLGPFYARWREKAGSATWRLLETYAGEIGG